VTTPKPIGFAAADDAEELARAEVYGLLAALFYAPPTAEMHARFQVAVTEAPAAGGFLERSWGELVAAARRLSREAIAREYDRLFQGVGKPEIFLYGSFHIAGRLNEKPLVALRHALRELGIEKSDAMSETEDHIASLCEVMRYLIAGDDVGAANLATQRRFFDAHLRPWVGALFDAIEAHPEADFYAALARFARDFFAVEQQAFDLLDS
jgi:TorA maturation chaperone TorD